MHQDRKQPRENSRHGQGPKILSLARDHPEAFPEEHDQEEQEEAQAGQAHAGGDLQVTVVREINPLIGIAQPISRIDRTVSAPTRPAPGMVAEHGQAAFPQGKPVADGHFLGLIIQGIECCQPPEQRLPVHPQDKDQDYQDHDHGHGDHPGPERVGVPPEQGQEKGDGQEEARPSAPRQRQDQPEQHGGAGDGQNDALCDLLGPGLTATADRGNQAEAQTDGHAHQTGEVVMVEKGARDPGLGRGQFKPAQMEQRLFRDKHEQAVNRLGQAEPEQPEGEYLFPRLLLRQGVGHHEIDHGQGGKPDDLEQGLLPVDRGEQGESGPAEEADEGEVGFKVEARSEPAVVPGQQASGHEQADQEAGGNPVEPVIAAPGEKGEALGQEQAAENQE